MSLYASINDTLIISTYPPRECGLATFTQDLITAIRSTNMLVSPKVLAVSDGNQFNYPKEVIMQIMQQDIYGYRKTPRLIDELGIKCLVIQHEYGIFGGQDGEYILELAKQVNIPVLTVFHTVLAEPTSKQREILKLLSQRSSKVITMSYNTVSILNNVYEVPMEKIETIQHGVPFRLVESRDRLKWKAGLEGRNVVSTFGLIGPGKGLEYGIYAMADVAKVYPDVIYLILGQTHPYEKQKNGENYRSKLIDLVDSLGLTHNVKFVDKYLSKDEIIHYLQMSDVYMTPYLNKEQAVSGTLAYAIGYGRIVVSTPYTYAREMLANSRGILANFHDAGSLARGIKYVFDNPDEKSKMEANTLKLGKTMMWDRIAKQYIALFDEVVTHMKEGVFLG